MNILSLKFSSNSIEKLYQQYRDVQFIYPTLKYYSIILSTYFFSQVIRKWINWDPQNFYINLTYLLCTIILGIVTHKYQIHNYSLTLINISIALNQWYNDTELNSHYSFLQGRNYMISSTVILFASDFTHGAIQIVCIGALRILIVTFQCSELNYEQISYTISMTLVLLLLIYKLNLNNRTQFLMTLKETQWESTLVNLLQETFYLFSFDKEKLKFSLIISNSQLQTKEQQQLELKEFLRNNLIDGNTLENYIFNRIKQNYTHMDPVTKCVIQLTQGHSKMEIEYSELNLPTQTFLIKVKPADQITLLKKQQQQELKHQSQELIQVVNKFKTLARKALQFNTELNLYRIIWWTHIVMSRLLIAEGTTTVVNIQKCTKKAVNLFNLTQESIHIRFQLEVKNRNSNESSFKNNIQYNIQNNIGSVQLFLVDLLQIIFRSTNKQDRVVITMGKSKEGLIQLIIHNVNVIAYLHRQNNDKEFKYLLEEFIEKQENLFNSIIYTLRSN